MGARTVSGSLFGTAVIGCKTLQPTYILDLIIRGSTDPLRDVLGGRRVSAHIRYAQA